MNSILTESVISLNDYFETKQVDAFFKLVDHVMEQLIEEQVHEQVIHFTLCKAILYFNVSHLTLASQVLAEKAPYIEQHGGVTQKIRYLNTLAAIQGQNDNLEQAFMYLERAKQLAEQYDRTHLEKIYHNLSVYYFNEQQFEDSLLYAQKSMAYFKAHHPEEPQNSRALINYAKILIAMKRLEEAYELLEVVKSQLRDDEGESRLAWVKTYVSGLEQQQQFDTAYAVLQQEIAQHPQQHGWNKELYELLCPLSKKTQSKERYLHDLKQLKQAMDLVNAEFVTTQLQAVKQYVDVKQFYEIAWRDPLTNVHNRKYLEEHYENFCIQYPAHTVLVFDIDHFKNINDTFGHIFGDQAIQKIADAVNYLFAQRESLFVRYGGDEFVACVPLIDVDDMTALLQRLQQVLAKQTMGTEKGAFHVTMSIGAFRVQQPTTLHTALSEADQALYLSKKNGRNRYTIR